MAELDADRALALTYVPSAKRTAVAALWQLDAALGQVLAGGREPLISQIKLAWWRESLQKLDRAPAPQEPVLDALAAEVVPVVTGVDLSRLEEAWTVLLSQEPLTEAELGTYAAIRGGLLFRYSATVLGRDLGPGMEEAGEAWALVDLARHSNDVDAAASVDAARQRLKGLDSLRWPVALRPIGMLASLAERDVRAGALEPQGAPGRMLRMLRHRLTGR